MKLRFAKRMLRVFSWFWAASEIPSQMLYLCKRERGTITLGQNAYFCQQKDSVLMKWLPWLLEQTLKMIFHLNIHLYISENKNVSLPVPSLSYFMFYFHKRCCCYCTKVGGKSHLMIICLLHSPTNMDLVLCIAIICVSLGTIFS